MSIYLDVIAGDDYRALDLLRETERREGPCEDDCEVTAPYIGMCPDESDHEEASPLNFKGQTNNDRDYYDQLFGLAVANAIFEADYNRILREGLDT